MTDRKGETRQEERLYVWRCPVHGPVYSSNEGPRRVICPEIMCGHEDLERIEVVPLADLQALEGELENTPEVTAVLPEGPINKDTEFVWVDGECFVNNAKHVEVVNHHLAKLDSLVEAVREHGNTFGAERFVRLDADEKLYATLDRIEGTDNGGKDGTSD